jgi:hypothetical protein
MYAGRSDALSPANQRLDLTNPGPGASCRARSDLQVSRQTLVHLSEAKGHVGSLARAIRGVLITSKSWSYAQPLL